jgi:mono/diheme cytochrome c family protein
LLSSKKEDLIMPARNAKLLLTAVVAVLLAAGVTLPRTNAAEKKASGEQLFNMNCFACHRNKDSNIIEPDKTIAKSKSLESEIIFKAFLSVPHKEMPVYKTIVRNSKELSALYTYIKGLK